MIPRVIIGKARGTYGLFVSPSGGNVETAPDAQLLINLTQKVSQIVMIGYVGGGTTVVPLGFSRAPFVFLNTVQALSNGLYTFAGRLSPAPYDAEGNGSRAFINGNGASMTISAGLAANFTVYNSAWT